MSGSVNWGDFLRILARGLANSCLTTLRLLRVVLCCGCSDLAFCFVFGWSLLVGVCHWIIWYRLPLLYCSTKNHPALLHAWTIAYLLIAWDSRFFLLSRRVTTFGAEAHLFRCEKSRISTSLARRPALYCVCSWFTACRATKSGKVDACSEFISALQRVKSVSCLIYKCLDN